jgi:UDP-galactopyranose mutase
LEPSQLKAGVAARAPVRTNTHDPYFSDTYQAKPLHGYARAFERMLDHRNIGVELDVGFDEVRRELSVEHVVSPRPIDAHFDAALADRESHVTFVGRLVQYRYYNMDQVVGGDAQNRRWPVGETVRKFHPRWLTARKRGHEAWSSTRLHQRRLRW